MLANDAGPANSTSRRAAAEMRELSSAWRECGAEKQNHTADHDADPARQQRQSEGFSLPPPLSSPPLLFIIYGAAEETAKFSLTFHAGQLMNSAAARRARQIATPLPP